MDRSLKFFTDIVIPPKNRDPKTGAPTTTHTVQTITSVYDPKDPLGQPIRVEQNTINYTVVQSLQADGTFVNYLGNSKTNNYDAFVSNPEHESDLSLSSLIKWSNQYPGIKLKPSHFVYLNDFNVYPNNRLMILRRFNVPADNNLFKMNIIPTNTLVTYYSLEEPPINISFKEKWTTFDGDFMDVLENVIGIKFDTIPGLGTVIDASSSSNIGQSIFNAIATKLGFVTPGGMPYGDPDIIKEAIIRDVTGEKVTSGLESNIEIDFESKYVFREINGYSAKFAMLDIISNIIHMGTSTERFYLRGKANKFFNGLLNEMSKANVEGFFTTILTELKSIVSGLIEKLTTFGQDLAALAKEGGAGAVLDSLLQTVVDLGGSIIKERYERYKWNLKGAISAMTGAPSAPWHISIGNPKAPWFTCGNLYIDNVELIPGGELSYDDMFSELTVKIKLKSGRSMGTIGLTNLFNNAKGRIYDTPSKIQKLKVIDGAQTAVAGNPNSVDGKNVSETPTQNIPSPTDTDKENELENTTQFGMNNTDIDNNLNPKST